MDNVKTTANENGTEMEQQELPLVTEEVDTQQELKYGYVVGVRENGEFVFNVTGNNIGVIELMGLQKYAESRVANIVNTNQGTGDAITIQLLARIDGLTAALKQLLEGNKSTTEEVAE